MEQKKFEVGTPLLMSHFLPVQHQQFHPVPSTAAGSGPGVQNLTRAMGYVSLQLDRVPTGKPMIMVLYELKDSSDPSIATASAPILVTQGPAPIPVPQPVAPAKRPKLNETVTGSGPGVKKIHQRRQSLKEFRRKQFEKARQELKDWIASQDVAQREAKLKRREANKRRGHKSCPLDNCPKKAKGYSKSQGSILTHMSKESGRRSRSPHLPYSEATSSTSSPSTL